MESNAAHNVGCGVCRRYGDDDSGRADFGRPSGREVSTRRRDDECANTRALVRSASTGRAESGSPPKGKYRSSVDAREPQNPTKSEEYQKHLQGVLHSTRGAQPSKTLVTNVVNTQDSQEQAPCATYWFLGLIQVPYEAPAYDVGLPKGSCRAGSRV
eukprot:1181836-Prorocentrum_minimum.AAC.5